MIWKIRHRWHDNIRMDLEEMSLCDLDLYGSVQRLVADPSQHGNEPLGFTNCWGFLE